MSLRCEAVLRLPQFDVLLGDFVLRDRVQAIAGHDFCVILKFFGYLDPDTSGLAGREYVIPLKALAEFLEKHIGENTTDGTNGILTYSSSPVLGCDETACATV